jgi:two-component system response regulator FixJ
MTSEQLVCIVDDDEGVRRSLEMLIRRSGYRVKPFDSARAFLAAGITAGNCCVLADVRMPEMDGLALQREINRTIPGLPVVIMTGHGDIPLAVQAMKDGAVEFLEKPFDRSALLGALRSAFDRPKQPVQPPAAAEARRPLTDREQEVFDLLVQGHQNKVVAHQLGISTRTVEVHRGRIMEKLNARNLADLVRASIGRQGS